MPEIQPLVTRSADRSRWIKQKVLSSLQKVFPIQSNKYLVELDNINFKDKDFTISDQKKAILEGKSLMIPVYVDFTIKELATGKVVEKVKAFKMADVPFLTNRMTMIIDGSDYSPITQLRLRSGAYSRKRENDIIEVFFNLAVGKNFRMIMEPQTGVFYLEVDTSKIPLYPLLIALGVQEQDVTRIWGADLVQMNKNKSGNVDVAVTKLYTKLFKYAPADTTMTTTEKVSKISAYFSGTKMDEKVNQSTLGHKAGSVTIPLLLAASKKILNISNSKEDTDDRDNLKFQQARTIDDALGENIEITSKEIVRKIKIKLDSLPKDKSPSTAMPKNVFGQTMKKFITTTPIASPLPQINPVDLIGNAYEITSMGPGGIKDLRMIRGETRQVNSSHLGIIDPVNTKENEKAGISLFATPNAYKDEHGNLYTKVINIKNNKEELLSVHDLEGKIVAFPNQDLTKKDQDVDVLYKGVMQKFPASKVEYIVKDASKMFTVQTNLLPFINSISGNRALMAAKHLTHALPLKYREEPLVQNRLSISDGSTLSEEKKVASLILPKSRIDGVVSKITEDRVCIKGKKGESEVDNYETNFPLNQKTFLHTTLNVRQGDPVKRGSVLGDSHYTKNGTLAIGTNLRTAYMSHKGLNINDGVVISEAAAKKLTSLHMNKVQYKGDDSHSVDKDRFTSLFPNKFNMSQLSSIEKNGVVKKGTILKEGDPIILGVEKTELSAEQSMLGNLHKKLYKPYRDDAQVWNNNFPGEVVDVVVSGSLINVLIKSEQQAQVGDKISNRSASKGVITGIIKDEEMYRDSSGRPIDILISPTSIISRQNPAQIIESSIAKVAEKVGKPIVVDSFNIKNNHSYAKDLLAKHSVSDKEDVYDPKTGTYIKNIFVGPQYITKQMNQADSAISARNFGEYDSNERPIKGGDTGSKGIGLLDINALISHNARSILKETSYLKGNKNKEFWNAYMRGLPLPTPKVPFSYNKMLGMLHASGIKVNKEDNYMVASPLTDRDVLSMSKGEVVAPYTVRAKDLRPESGGLFDPYTTGGTSGKSWSHIKLQEPVINPIMKSPVQTLLGVTAKGLEDKIKIEGVNGIAKQLSQIDIDSRIAQLNKEIPTLKFSNLDKAIKEMKYLRALKATGLKPHEAYILNNIPVLPPIMRPISKLPGSRDLLVAPSNRMYADVIHHNKAMEKLKQTMGSDQLGDVRVSLQKTVDALVGVGESPNQKIRKQGYKGFLTTISGDVPKQGFFQSKVVSKAQDMSARGVITPDPTLNMDQVGIPEHILWGIYKPFVVKRLVSKGYPATTALDMVEKKDVIAKQELNLELKERPVLINRAPTLHKHNIVAAYPVLTDKKSITISPFIEKGMNSDYDGDAMQVHVPVLPKSVREAQRMTPSNILFVDKFKTNALYTKPEQDTNYGIHSGLNAPAIGKSFTASSYDEVLNAYKSGKIKLTDQVKIKQK